MGMKASAKFAYGSDSLEGKKIFVQGIGNVGENLVKYLVNEGAKVTIFDIHEEKLIECAKATGATVFKGNDVYEADMDIYAPCALGATVNSDSIAKLKCSIIAGAANNQLEDELVHGNMLLEKGIVWAPDFLINAGGLINVYSELHGYNREVAMSNAQKIYELTGSILRTAQDESITTIVAAKNIAEKRISEIGKIKLSF
jgi:leucine dehydrogenase